MANKFSGSSGLKAPGEIVEYTKNDAIEVARCIDDPIYFIENFTKIVHVDKGLVNFQLYPYQKDLVNIMHNNRYSIFKMPRQSGKCLKSLTKIKIRNKISGKIEETTLEEFFNRLKET